jgi:hypothetical protein
MDGSAGFGLPIIRISTEVAGILHFSKAAAN